MGFLEKIGFIKLVISEDDILEMTRKVLSQPWAKELPDEAKNGAKFSLHAVLNHLVEKEITSEETRKKAAVILEEWHAKS